MKKIFYVPVLFIVLFMVFLTLFELNQGRESYYTVMENKSSELIKAVITFRDWFANLENVYADSDKVEPNPYLGWRGDRDISSDGLHLTMINPAYMTRLISEQFKDDKGIRLKIVGMHPVNPDNYPNKWEMKGLEVIQAGADHYSAPVHTLFKELSYRYVQPLYIQKSCFACHFDRGFKEGDIAGALTLELPAGKVASRLLLDALRSIVIYFIMAAMLIITFALFQRKLLLMTKKQEETIDNLNTEISKRELSEKALVQQTRAASQGELLSLVAHHWRQPLTSISLTLDLLKDELEEKGITEGDTVNSISQSLRLIQGLSRTIDTFRNQFKKGNGAGAFSISRSVTEALNIISPVLQSLNIMLFVIYREGGDTDGITLCTEDCMDKGNIPCEQYKLYGKSRDLRQILLTAVKNSYEAIEEKRHSTDGTFRGMISVSVAFTESTVTISVRDNGIGAGPESAAKAFEPYYTTKGYEYGKGMGLFLAKNIVKEFDHGSISLVPYNSHTELVISAGLAE